MGTIRVLLAFAVIFSHTGSHVLVGGEAALQCFYLISGFLISYILQNTAAYGNLSNFYLNRFLRIYPMYWVVAQILLPRVERLCEAVPRLETVAVAALVVMILTLPMTGEDILLKKVILLLVMTFALPFLFIFQKHNSWGN
jgi:hypothetical protein